MRMKSNSTFRRFLMNLAITAACVVMPVKAWGADYIDLVNNSLVGWTLYWGSANTSTSGSYYWDATTAKTAYLASNSKYSWNDGYDKLYGSISAYDITSNTHGVSQQQYAPDVDYTTLGKDDSWKSYRFYVNSKSGSTIPYDVLFTNNTDNPCLNKGMALKAIPDGFNSSIRLGSCEVPSKGHAYSSAEFQDK